MKGCFFFEGERGEEVFFFFLKGGFLKGGVFLKGEEGGREGEGLKGGFFFF